MPLAAIVVVSGAVALLTFWLVWRGLARYTRDIDDMLGGKKGGEE